MEIKLEPYEDYCVPAGIPRTFVPKDKHLDYVISNADADDNNIVTSEEASDYIGETCKKFRNGDLEREIKLLNAI